MANKFLGEEGQDLSSRLTPEARALIKALIDDPEFQPRPEDFERGPDPLGLNWSWLHFDADVDRQAREQAEKRAELLVQDPSFRRLLAHLFDVAEEPIHELVDHADFWRQLS